MGNIIETIIARLRAPVDPANPEGDQRYILPETPTTAVFDPADGTTLDVLLSNKANRAQPETYDLPLLDGISKHHQAFFYKTANDIVTVSFSISIEEGEFEVYNEIAILPEGFRPAELIENACTMSSAGTYSPGTVQVLPDGVIKILLLQQGGFVAHSSCISFLATV